MSPLFCSWEFHEKHRMKHELLAKQSLVCLKKCVWNCAPLLKCSHTQAYSVFPSPKHLKHPECLGTVWNHGPWSWWNHRSSRYWLIVCISATFSNNDPTYWNTIPNPCWRPNMRCPFFAVAAAAFGPEGVDIFIHIIQYLSIAKVWECENGSPQRI